MTELISLTAKLLQKTPKPNFIRRYFLSIDTVNVAKDASIAEMQKLAKEVFFPNVTQEDLLRDEIRDSLKNDCFGIAQDLRIRCMDWGFALSEVRAAVYMEHSRTDSEVPFVTAEITARMIPNCRLEAREGEHFSGETLDRFIRNIVLSH